MPDYITPHHGGGWKYQMAVPLKLRPLIGKKVFVEYIKPMTRRDALAKAREFAVRDAAKLAAAREIDPRHQTLISFTGGLSTAGYLREEQKQRLYFTDRGALDAIKHIERAGETAVVAVLLSWDRLFEEWKKARSPSHTPPKERPRPRE